MKRTIIALFIFLAIVATLKAITFFKGVQYQDYYHSCCVRSNTVEYITLPAGQRLVDTMWTENVPGSLVHHLWYKTEVMETAYVPQEHVVKLAKKFPAFEGGRLVGTKEVTATVIIKETK